MPMIEPFPKFRKGMKKKGRKEERTEARVERKKGKKTKYWGKTMSKVFSDSESKEKVHINNTVDE